MKDLAKLMAGGQAGKEHRLDPKEKDIKTSILEDIISAMQDMVASKYGEEQAGMLPPMDGMEKVTVAADDEEGLKKGLDKAKDLVGELPELDEEEEDEELFS